MMNRIAFLYPGQGAQKAGMGADFYEKSPLAAQIFDEAGKALGLDMKALCFEKNEKLDQTEYTQAAMVTTCLAMTEVLKERGMKADMSAGLSLGEYCAISAAGGMKPMDAIRLVRKRGILMQNTVPAGEGTMCAVLGMDAGKIEDVLAKYSDAAIANYNCPGQIVITGKTDAVKEAAEKLKEAGAKRTILLNVSGPFHSPMLLPAGEELRKELEKTELSALEIPYVTNVTAEVVTDISKTKDLLVRQVSAPVRWMQSMETMLAEGITAFVEIGPGRTLTGFLRKISRDIFVKSVGTWEEMEEAVEALAKDRQPCN